MTMRENAAKAAETIEDAAIHYKGITYSLPRPARHIDVARHIMTVLKRDDLLGETQGFVTSEGRFVRREPAIRIAKKAGQIIVGKFNERQLFSEDLW